MRFLPNNPRQNAAGRPVTALFAVLAGAYPFLVYLFHERVSFIVFALGASMLLLLRACFASSGWLVLFRLPLIGAAAALIVLSLIDATLAAKIYPALVSLMVAALFGSSLRHGPSLIERIARLRDPDLSAAGQEYCRRLTWIWTLWLLFNASVAALLAALPSVELWTLWTGVISYLCSGALFVGEMILRRRFAGAGNQRGRDA